MYIVNLTYSQLKGLNIKKIQLIIMCSDDKRPTLLFSLGLLLLWPLSVLGYIKANKLVIRSILKILRCFWKWVFSSYSSYLGFYSCRIINLFSGFGRRYCLHFQSDYVRFRWLLK